MPRRTSVAGEQRRIRNKMARHQRRPVRYTEVDEFGTTNPPVSFMKVRQRSRFKQKVGRVAPGVEIKVKKELSGSGGLHLMHSRPEEGHVPQLPIEKAIRQFSRATRNPRTRQNVYK
ncbi:MAG: hypothetical protein HY544_01030 [Candidatus Diapherotrites archaeon]|uniref:Uncharacterized protein n=1 Tax=Candidatus Iainarchaeum sp. TaxID=3101447 RepID=A0A8T3YJ49_9ARCH|nr:hypothetical protein [Candidatus Diapherotrites archaeon]